MARIAAALFALSFVMHAACRSTDPQPDSGQWQPAGSIAGAFRRDLVGDARMPGPFKYQLRVPAGTRIAAHRHSVAVHVKVLTGSMFIIVDDPLEPSRARHFLADDAFVVPPNAWHVEWWDEQSVMEAEGDGPMITTYRLP